MKSFFNRFFLRGNNKKLFSLLLVFFLLSFRGYAYEKVTGPIVADVIRVVDGDTVVVKAHIWLGHNVETVVRILGVNTPEIRGKCSYEKYLAVKAKKFVTDFVKGKVSLFEVSYGKYAGRIVARVVSDKGDVAEELIKKGLAHRYSGGRRKSWCETAEK